MFGLRKVERADNSRKKGFRIKHLGTLRGPQGGKSHRVFARSAEAKEER
jgi:hypothetical protein